MKNFIHPHYFNVAAIRLSSMVWKVINYFSAYWWRVNIGGRCVFRGTTIFRLLPGSKITIGRRCAFNSNHRSNLIGVYSPCMISTISRCARIEIGEGCGFSGTVIGAALSIKLGRNVRCGANTLITDSDWHADDSRTGADKPVEIGNNVWLGYGVKVLKGVKIGDNSLIGAGSVVTRDIPANVIAAGNPCRVIKIIENEK